jgi:hypothetical protein
MYVRVNSKGEKMTLKDSIWDDAVFYPAETLKEKEQEEEETTTVRLFIWEKNQ